MQHATVFALALAALLASAAPALACACCPYENENSLGAQALSSTELEVLKQLRFAPTARFNTGPEDSSDYPALRFQSSVFDTTAAWTGNALRMTLRNKAGGGAVHLTMPNHVTRLAADIHDGKKFSGGGPLLYKEWRLEGHLKHEGLFKPGKGAPTGYVLVFQARGGNCDEPEQFTHWHLTLNAPDASYAFSGTLKP